MSTVDMRGYIWRRVAVEGTGSYGSGLTGLIGVATRGGGGMPSRPNYPVEWSVIQRSRLFVKKTLFF